jgi:beta-phosphoglucomutase-like phosphatase (HAD superfamily)
MRGLTLGLATASNRKIYRRYCELNEMDHFPPQYIVAHGECKDDKPKPGPFLEVMRRMDVKPERTLIIEDSGSGITAGRYAGAIVLGLATTKSTEYLQTKTGAQIVAEDFKDATRLIQDLLPN